MSPEFLEIVDVSILSSQRSGLSSKCQLQDLGEKAWLDFRLAGGKILDRAHTKDDRTSWNRPVRRDRLIRAPVCETVPNMCHVTLDDKPPPPPSPPRILSCQPAHPATPHPCPVAGYAQDITSMHTLPELGRSFTSFAIPHCSRLENL